MDGPDVGLGDCSGIGVPRPGVEAVDGPGVGLGD